MTTNLKLFAIVLITLSFAGTGATQTLKKKNASKKPATSSSEEMKALRDTVSAQQQQIEALRADVQKLIQLNTHSQQSAQQAQSAADQAKSSVAEAQTALAEAKKAADHAEFSAAEAKTKEQLDKDASDKNLDEVASVVRRFRPHR